ncbi:MAG: RagB/SusD family nutrient uptake outer membrane protein [Chitinophagaceae bacterium]|jgi:hypothetical protein|nr:RagB/SusD family nutrient uptake outer membrane protein [Chitinophagaceae bacterium]
MKTLKRYTTYSILAASLALGACNKDLNTTPPYQLTTGNAFKSLDDYNQQLNGVYGAGFAAANYYNSFLGCTADVLSDDLYETIESLVNYQRVANWEFLSNDGYMAGVWLTPYNTILQANVIINGIDQFKSENEKKYNRILGQALASRAIAHFDLLKAHADNLDRNSTDPGVAIKTNTNIEFPARNTVKEVYDAIYADLNKAISLLGDVDAAINTASNRSGLDIWGARAAFARVALYAKDYATAVTQSTAVINQFPLASRANFPGIWNDANVSEVIWSIKNLSGDPGSPFPSNEVMSYRFNRNTFGVTPALLNSYDQANDIRFSTYFFIRNTSAGGTINNYAVQKFRGKGAASDNLVDFKVFRTGEMYLIRAEANARLGGANEVAANADLNALRTARINGWVAGVYTGATLLNEIALERRRELAVEGHRWFDLKRTTRVLNRSIAGTGNPNAQVKTTLATNSTKWVWPIPEAEVNANKAMVQNPGY